MADLLRRLMAEAPGDGAPAGGGDSAPPAAPATPAPASVPGEAPTSELDLSDIFASDNADDAVKPDASPAKPPVDPAPAAPVAPAETPPAQPPVQPTPQPPAPVAPPAAPAVQPQPPVQPAPPADVAPDLNVLRQQEQKRLESVYALSEADKQAVLVEPDKVLPRMAAQIHTTIFESVVQTLMAALPNILESHQQQRADREGVRNQFYSEFPALKDPKYERDVQTALMTYKHLNPTATREQAIAAAGVQVSITHRLPLPAKYMDGLHPPPPAAPTTPPPSFAPASPGSASVPASPGPDNYFAKIAQEDILDG